MSYLYRGAASGNRTRVVRLEVSHSTIELPPHLTGAGGENRTPNLLITSELPYHWATPA